MKSLIRFAAILFVVSSGLTSSMSQAATAPTTPNAGPLRDGQNAMTLTVKTETGGTLQVQIPKASLEEIAKNSPEALRQRDASIRQSFANQCSGKVNVFSAVAHEFPGEAGAFYAGLAMSARLQMHGDPAAFEHFYQHNVVSLMGHTSFAFFMLGSRMTTGMLVNMGLGFDPCHNLKKGRNINFDKEGRPVGTPGQQRFAKFMGPLSMTGGFLLSSLANEFLTDPNIQTCSGGFLKSTTGKDAANPEQKKAIDQACSQAYKDWVSTRKIVNYMPDLLSMTITSAIQGYVINGALSAATKAAQGKLANISEKMALEASMKAETRLGSTLLIRSISVAANFTPGGPLVRFGVQAAGALIFVTINDIIVHPLKWYFERWRQGRDITGEINDLYSELDRVEKGGWAWTPKPLPPECSYEPTMWDYQNGYLPPFYCSKDTEKISNLIDQLNEKSKKWRETVLADAYTAHSNWKDYIGQFQSTYTNAHNFDANILSAIAYKNDPSNPPDPLVTKLYDTVATNGVDSSFFSDICKISSEQKAKFKDAASYAVQALDQLKTGALASYDRSELEDLTTVTEGLKAVDCNVTTAAIEAVRATLSKELGGIRNDANLVAKFTAEARSKQVRQALDLIFKVLHGNSALAMLSGARAGMMKAPANENPFFILDRKIGDSRPQPAGSVYISELENDEMTINQTTKDQHPSMMGNIATNTMTHYLLASMVCGPTARESYDSITSGQLATQKQTTFGWLLQVMGLDNATMNRFKDPKSLIYLEYAGKDSNSPISGTYGVRANFHPPMIIKLPDTDANRNLCQEARVSLLGAPTRTADPRDVELTIGGDKTVGLLDVVKRYANPDIFGADTSTFENYWAKFVDPHVIKTIGIFEEDFKHIVAHDFIPSLTRTDFKIYRDRRFEIGTIKSLESQVHLNLLLLGKSFFPKTTVKSPDAEIKLRREFVKSSIEFQRRMSLELQLFTGDDAAKAAMDEIEKYAFQNATAAMPANDATFRKRMQTDSEYNQKSMLSLLKTMQEMPNARSLVNAEAVKTLQDVQGAAVNGIEALVTESSSYFGIIDTAHIDGMN